VNDVNYRYFVHYVTELSGFDAPRVLDFGCGNGFLVRLLRQGGVECYGADVLYGGAQYDALAESGYLDTHTVREIVDGRLPFDDKFFDVVVSNQVFEHVEQLDETIDELYRVMDDDGVGYHHFPSREVVREGHTGIPLAHRLTRSQFRYQYALACRRLGLGCNKGDLAPEVWAQIELEWIDRYCFYRPYAILRAAFERRFVIRHRETDYCRFRARSRVNQFALRIDAFSGIYERLLRRLAFMALELRKRATI
jgi:SAM-dependent methyltransferase